jgi:deoxycytidine triphosphate deaminase
MVLGTDRINELLKSGELALENSSQISVEEPNFELSFGDKAIKYKPNEVLDLKSDNSVHIVNFDIPKVGLVLEPGEFIVVQSKEKITLPQTVFGYIVTRGSIAKIGLQIHLCSPHIDPGTNSTIALEVKNNSNNSVRIYPNHPVAKVYLFEMLQ